jgi:peptide chain release factor subunit 1
MIVFGVADTMKALEMSALEKVLLFDEIEHVRYIIKNPVSGETKTWYLTPA